MRKISYIIIMAMLTSTFTACAEEATTGVTAYAQFSAEYTDRDGKAEYKNEKVIDLSSGSVTISTEGVYVLTGVLDGGSVIIDAPETDKVQLVLRDASITSTDGAAIYAKQCDKLFITLEGNNAVTDGATYTFAEGEDEPDAAIFAKNDVTINGSGTLNVAGNYKHGIASKDDVKLISGTVNIKSVEDGIKGKDSVLIKAATLNISAGTDGIVSDNDSGEDKGRISIDGGSVRIVCGNDGIQAESVLQVNGGVIDIKSGDEENTEIKVSEMGRMPGGMGMPPEGMSDGMRIPPEGMPGGMEMLPEGMPDGTRIPPEGMSGSRGMRPGNMDGMPQGDMMHEDETKENSVSIKGLKSANALYINGGEITVSAQDDAIHSDIALEINGTTMNLRSADDAIHAEYSTVINDGNITVERCYEGIEGKAIVINGGNIHIDAEDDGINASDPTVTQSMPGRGDNSIYIEINGGVIDVVSGFDSLDSNGNIMINGGVVLLDGPSGGMDCAIDCDGRAYVNGGEVAAAGVGAAAAFAEESEQGSITVLLTSGSAEGETALYDSKGDEIISTTPGRAYGGVVFSSDKLNKGDMYTVKCGDVSVDVELSELHMIVNEKGEVISVSNMGGRMPGGKGGKRVSFSDVADDAWYSGYVRMAASMGIMEGKNGAFMPETITTRAEYVQSLYKAAGSPAVENMSDFEDVSADCEYANAVAWAQAQGIAEGDGNGKFNPDGSLTREMAVTFLYRALDELRIVQTETEADAISGFADNENVSEWAREPMNELIKTGVITGTDENRLNPRDALINAEVAAIVCRVIGKRDADMRRM